MRYTVTFCEPEYDRLQAHLNSEKSEQAAYLLCGLSVSNAETRLLVREVIPVADGEIVYAQHDRMSISSQSFTRAMKRASDSAQCFVFVHSHPGGFPRFSPQDDEEEKKLFRTAYTRIRTLGVHASILFCPVGVLDARVWLEDGTFSPIELVRVVGRRFRYWFLDGNQKAIPEFFDRQVRAFGADTQQLLERLRVGIVGVGGTGSAVVEQLIRLGVGSLLLADGDTFESSNINRVYGSRLTDDGTAKVEIAKRHSLEIGLGTTVRAIPQSVCREAVLREFRECDAIFCCTDDQWGRSLLTALAIYYYIPVFDMGVRVDSDGSTINSIQGRVTTLMPGAACLYCRGRISAARVQAESVRETSPEKAAALTLDGYIAAVEDVAPAVIPFTTMIAAGAVTEFLHRLTGLLGPERLSTEVLHLIDDSRLRTNQKEPQEDCFCGRGYARGRGDTQPFLDSTWLDD